MAEIRPIRTESDYKAALTRIDELMDAELGSPEGGELDVLVDLVELYESKHEPMGHPTPLPRSSSAWSRQACARAT